MSKCSANLRFEEQQKRPSKLSHAARDAPLDAVRGIAHRKLREDEDDNPGIDAANTLTETAETGTRMMETAHRSNAHRKTGKSDTANSPKWQQKQAIKKEYASPKAGKPGTGAASTAPSAAKKAEKAAEKAKAFLAKNKKGLIVIGILGLLAVFLLNTASSCSVFVEGGLSAIGISTYPSKDDAMLGAEGQYKGLENALRRKLDNYERNHDYDEYHFERDEISHDPYVLISTLTALKKGPWTLSEVQGDLQMLFDLQYVLTEEVITETRYRTETRIGSYAYTDPETGQRKEIDYDYDVQVPYTYTICNVKLVNNDLSHIPVEVLSQQQLSLYAMYMGTLGNRQDLFTDSAYIGRYDGNHGDYEIPPEALEDEQFAAIIREAEKYLGYPYVWGGSSPSTSFDCSGFVSYVYNNCGEGWDFGRLSAEGLRGISSYVSPSDAKPGDLIFFEGTYNTTGASHVGIYVGNNQMLHCGDPVQYTSIDSSYYQEHFMMFGRLE